MTSTATVWNSHELEISLILIEIGETVFTVKVFDENVSNDKYNQEPKNSLW